MSIENIQTLAPQGIGGLESPAAKRELPDGPGAAGFSRTLGEALAKVDGFQVEADNEAEQVALGGGNLHEMAMAMEKADISMRLAMKVRSKLIDAYQDIMKTGL